jgi:iron complex outermembrane receptor protein
MRLSIRLLILFCTLLCVRAEAYGPIDKGNLRGRVSDTRGGPLPGAIVELPDLHTGVATDDSGNYEFKELPTGRYVISVKLLGFETQSARVLVSGDATHDFRLSEAVLEQHEVIVTGTSAATEQRRNPMSVQSISGNQLKEQASTNIVDALSQVPGVQQISTGPAISKPVIRGLSGNRVLSMQDGIRQEGQQWGDEHGLEIDDENLSRIELVRGPASLAYGSDALAGVINVLSEPPPKKNTWEGDLGAGYQSNPGLATFHGRFAANPGLLNFGAYYNGKRAHDYENKYDGPVFNTRFRNDNYGANIGIERNWGSSRILFNSFNQQLGIAEGMRDSVTGDFLKPVNDQGQLIYQHADDGKSYDPANPRQEIRHQKISWLNTFYGNDGARWNLNLAWQENRRREFDNVLNPSQPGLDLRLRTLNYTLHYVFPNIRQGLEFSAGVNGMLQKNSNEGIAFLIPDYQLFDAGGFVLVKQEWNKWTLSGGLRMDVRNLRSDDLFLDSVGIRTSGEVAGGEKLFSSFERTFSSPSGSIGVSYTPSKHFGGKLNFASGYRAPNIAELSANGVHEGAIRYEYGDHELKPEHSYQLDLGLQYNSEHISVNASGFYSFMPNFIFVQKLVSSTGQDSIPQTRNEESFPAFAYTQHDARLFGGELYADFHPHPLDWLHLESTLSYVQGRTGYQDDSMKYLPMIPQTRCLIGLRAQTRKLNSWLSNAFARIEFDHYFPQNQVYSAYGTETSSLAYSLFNASLGFDLMQKDRRWASVIISAQNLTDEAYQNHLSRLRFADVNPATGRTGIYGMGRNISIRLEIPFAGHLP